MKTLLQINSSILSTAGQSSQLAQDPVPHLDAAGSGAFLGITDVAFVYAEGLAISEQSKAASLAQARRDVEGLLTPLALAA